MSELSERNRIAAQQADERYYARLLEAHNQQTRTDYVGDYLLAAARRARYRAAISFLKFAGALTIGVLICMGVWLIFYTANGGFLR